MNELMFFVMLSLLCSTIPTSIKISTRANYIFGRGNDSWDTMQETLSLGLELNAENANFYCATALPGSSLYLKAKKESWKLPGTYEAYGFLA